MSNFFKGPLGRVAAQLERQYEAKAQSDADECYRRDQIAGKSHVAEALKREVQVMEHEALLDSTVPACGRYDAYRVVKAAADEAPSDRGLKVTAKKLFDSMQANPTGALTVGDLVSLHAEISDRFPKSAALSILDTDIPNAIAFQNLPNLDYLTRVASSITDQASYEDAVEDAGLTSNSIQHRMARGWIRAIAESDASDTSFSFNAPNSAAAMQTAFARLAQEIDEADNAFGAGDEGNESRIKTMNDGQPSDHGFGTGSDGDEDSDNSTVQLDSPISGEPISIELSEAAAPDMDDADNGDSSSDTSAMPALQDSEEANGDFGKMGQEDRDLSEDDNAPQGLSVTPEGVVGDNGMAQDDDQSYVSPNGAEPKDSEPLSTSVIVKDPSTGDDLKLTLEPLNKEAVAKVCAGVGITASALEASLLNGDWVFGGREVTAGVKEWAIGIDTTDAVCVAKYAASGEVEKVVKAASIADMDEVVEDFMARVAFQVKSAAASKRQAARKAPTISTRKAAYAVSASVPNGAPINAKRMIAAVNKVVPGAEFELHEDGSLLIRIASAEERDINRIRRVFADTFGVECNAQEQPQQQETVAPTNPANPPVPGQLNDPEEPYNGDTAVTQQDPGAPIKPMTGQMPTPNTGMATQQAFISKHTDPMRSSASARKQAQEDAMPEVDPEEGEEPPAEDGLGDTATVSGTMLAEGAPGEEASVDPAHMLPSGMGLKPEHVADVAAAMTTFRNVGDSPLDALDEFKKKFSGLLDSYGEPASAPRMAAEANVIKLMSEAFAKPSILVPTPEGAAPKTASVKVKWQKQTTDFNVPVKKPSPKGKLSDKSMPAPFPKDLKLKTKPESAKAKMTDNKFPKMPQTDALNKVPHSSKKAEATAEDYVVGLEAKTASFDVRKAGKVLTRCEDLNSAFADAERRQVFGGRIFHDDGNGKLVEVA